MTKQIKLGLDKVPSPITNQFVPLYDIATGIPLRDIADQIIVTEIEGALDLFYLSGNSTPVSINHDSTVKSVPIAEAFPLVSEVSSTLLGVPRAEEQLSLFSDVSTYGIDDDSWEYFTFNNFLSFPDVWYSRKNPVYGNRSALQFYEGTNEQALYLKAFPVNFSYPFGPGWERSGRYNETLFLQYMKWIALGKAYYKFYSENNYQLFADTNFIPDYIKIVDSSGEEISTGVLYGGGFTSFVGETLYYDVDYGEDLNKAFEQIERWTTAYRDILNRDLPDPSGRLYADSSTGGQLDLFSATASSTDIVRPGYNSGNNYTGVLQSREAFRYQPGRISGFTFGVRLRTDPRSTSNFIEIGCVNDTDQYVFQLAGSQFNIVRRSTVPFDNDLLIRQGLNPTFQSDTPIFPLGGFASVPLYETAIPRDNFNGDALNGNGPSGYILSFEDVTMYKIEFGWYGAIGAKFYAYVPFGNDGARWVLIHTLVIENGMGKPSLENPNFRFRYLLGVADTSLIREPIYVYKYGASYYIDGGDEGTKKVLSGSSSPKEFIDFTPNIGIFPKSQMLNTLGEAVRNRKQVYPKTLSVNSTTPSKVDIIEISGSPEGHHFHYSPSLHNTRNAKTRDIQFIVSESGDAILTDPGVLTQEDVGKKIVGDGLYNVYIGAPNDSGDSAPIRRRSAYNLNLLGSADDQISENVELIDGSVVDPKTRSFSAKLVGYDKIVASDIGVYTNTSKIHFLNPVARDPDFGGRHFCDFVIGVTPLKPQLGEVPDVDDQGNDIQRPALLFGDNESQREITIDDPELISVDWSAYQEQNALNGQEIREWDPTYGIKFDLDPRLPRPLGEDSGIISGLVVTLTTIDYFVTEVETVGSEIRLYLRGGDILSAPRIDENSIGIAELGIDGLPTGITIDSLPIREGNREYILVSGNPENNERYNNVVQLKTVELSDNFQVKSYDENGELQFQYKTVLSSKQLRFNVTPLYFVVMMRDHAQINNIVIEEISSQTNYSHTPNWLTVTDIGEESVIKFSGQSSIENGPSNFVSTDRLSSVRLDTQTQQPLRPGNTIYSLFVDGASTETIDLSNIFNYDRKKIVTGLYNNRATFFTASPLNSNFIGDSEISLTVEEQQ